jgi:lipid-binding SYLF domain-containing protein
MKHLAKPAWLAFGLMLALTACATAPSTTEEKTDLEDHAISALNKAESADPTLHDALTKSAGYAVFPSIGKGGVGVGGAYGKGVVFQNGQIVGYCDLTQATVGLELGGQSYTEIIAFQNPETLQSFKSGDFAFNAQATAVALKSGAGANAPYRNGVAVFTTNEAGLMYEASIGGQKFSYQPKEIPRS